MCDGLRFHNNFKWVSKVNKMCFKFTFQIILSDQRFDLNPNFSPAALFCEQKKLAFDKNSVKFDKW